MDAKNTLGLVGLIVGLIATPGISSERWVNSADLTVDQSLDPDDGYGCGYYRHCHGCGTSDDLYGCSVAICGNRIVVGSPERDIVLNLPYYTPFRHWWRQTFWDAGAAYLFENRDGGWQHVKTFWPNLVPASFPPDNRDGDRCAYCDNWESGQAVAISTFDADDGPRGSVLIGQPGFTDVTRYGINLKDDRGRSGMFYDQGRVLSFIEYVSSRSSYFYNWPTCQIWQDTVEGTLTDKTFFGGAVSTWGGFAAIGCRSMSSGYCSPGVVKVCEMKNGYWKTVLRLEKPGMGYGWSLRLMGYSMIVGDIMANTAEIWERQQGAKGLWIKKQTLRPPTDANGYGQTVSIACDYAVVGAPYVNNHNGQVYVYHRNAEGQWDLVHTLPPIIGQDGQNFGYSVALSPEGRLLVGAPRRGDGGCVYLFRLAYVNGRSRYTYIQNLQPHDLNYKELGFSVAIDGECAVVGAPGAGVSDGRAFVFKRFM